MSKKTFAFILIVLLLIAGGIYYWFFYINGKPISLTGGTDNGGAFVPYGRNTVTPSQNRGSAVATSSNTIGQVQIPVQKMPVVRQISQTPIGGFMASSTASTTVTRYIDRGMGHIFEANGLSLDSKKISNTTLPKIYESYWNKNGTALILRYIREGTDTVASFYAQILPVKGAATSSNAANSTAFEIKGKFLAPEIKEIAVSPKADRVFTFNVEDARGEGYISGFDESKKTKILDTPLMLLNPEWPEENTITLTTKASGASLGFMYSLDAKTGALKKVLGNIPGLTTRTSKDAKNVLVSFSSSQGIGTSVYNIKNGTFQSSVFKTLADKCVWSKLHTNEVYCAVPTSIPSGTYPDDWYKGTVSLIDQIWHFDASTGEIHLLADLPKLSGRLIDVMNPTLDPKEDFLYFMDKNDLSFWSLDLNQ